MHNDFLSSPSPFTLPLSLSYISIECDLEGRFSQIRTRETNLGNLVTDIMRKVTRSDVALLNSGTFRSNTIHQAGEFRVKVSHTQVHFRTCAVHE